MLHQSNDNSMLEVATSPDRECEIIDPNYLKRGQKESSRNFITNGREILMKQITINDKIEETTHLKEFIESEEEQLKEGRRLFEEDKQKFFKYVAIQFICFLYPPFML